MPLAPLGLTERFPKLDRATELLPSFMVGVEDERPTRGYPRPHRQVRQRCSCTSSWTIRYASAVALALPANIQKELFSFAYVRAVATVAGCSVTTPSTDHDSVDLVIESRIRGKFGESPRLEVQAKCTASPKVRTGAIAFDLPMKNYHDLRKRSFVPRILVLATVPSELPSDWVKFTQMGLLLKCQAFWRSLHGDPDVSNSSKVQIKVPTVQQFTVDNLSLLMQRIADGESP